MTSLHDQSICLQDLSIDAADTVRGREIFRREGVAVVKGLLPFAPVDKTFHKPRPAGRTATRALTISGKIPYTARGRSTT
jgi:hypothetical protein